MVIMDPVKDIWTEKCPFLWFFERRMPQENPPEYKGVYQQQKIDRWSVIPEKTNNQSVAILFMNFLYCIIRQQFTPIMPYLGKEFTFS